jgi:hypothetical protein
VTDPEPDRSTAAPVLIALAIAVIALIAIGATRLVRGDSLPEDAAVGRAVVAQNDALQRRDYTDLQSYTCTAGQEGAAAVLAAQQRSEAARGARIVENVTDIAVIGDTAKATVVYHFEKTPGDKVTVPVTFAREGGEWKVCSTGPR